MSKSQQILNDIKMRALGVLPKNAVSRLFGAVAEVELPAPIQSTINHGFARLFGLNLDESEHDPAHYTTLNAFFTRRLKEGSRTSDTLDEDALVSPVDGRITQFGPVDRGTLIQAKGRSYDLVGLLDGGAQAERFAGGSYATIYLSPKDYHRIHSPVSGSVEHVSYIPGHLWPVNPLSVSRVDRLFAVNERLITYIDTEEIGRVAVIKVGATCVGRIGLSFNEMQSNQAFRRRQEIELEQGVEIAHGDDLAVFNLGSTVILLIESDRFAFEEDIVEGQALRMGQLLGRIGATTS